MRTQSFDQTVRQICALREDPRARSYIAVANACKIVLDQLNMFVLKDFTKSIIVTVTSDLAIDFPDDFVDYSKIGVMTDKGIKVLGYNPRIQLTPSVTSPTCTCGEETEEETSTTSVCEACTFSNLYYGNTMLGEYYGWRVPQNTEGSWRIDWASRKILLNSGTEVFAGAELILEYKPGLGSEQLMLIPKAAFLMIAWKTCELLDQMRRPQVALMHAAAFKKEYDAYKKLVDETTPWDIVKAIRHEYTPSVKR